MKSFRLAAWSQRARYFFDECARLVDQDYYFQLYKDVAASGMSAAAHYNNFGWKEGRNPSEDFHTLYYATKFMPGGRLASNPLRHFITASRRVVAVPASDDEWLSLQKERVAYRFQDAFYRARYWPHLDAQSPLDHYFGVGWTLGFDPREDFSTKAYLGKFDHLPNSKVNPFFHFIAAAAIERDTGDASASAGETRSARQTEKDQALAIIAGRFDRDYYLRKFPDIKRAGVDPVAHYATHGWREGRNPSPFFWTDFYLANYPDARGSTLNPFHHFLALGEAKGYRPNPLGHDFWPRPRAPDAQAWELLSPATEAEAGVTVVIPVYKGYDETLAAIYAALFHRQQTRFELVVINDRGPEAQLTEVLRDLAKRKLFAYFENDENIGFVRTVNRAAAMRPCNDLVLLNADTIVFGDWLDRLLWHAKHEPLAATITPFSNNATICSYPQSNQNNELALECELETLDQFAKICNKGLSTRVPTGVGFCLFMRRSVIDKIGGFDEDFGRGYGEENDFCMRALRAGYVNLLAHDVFVYHRGQISFADFLAGDYGADQMSTLLRKHPDYGRRVEEFINADPAQGARLRLDLYRFAKSLNQRVAVLITIEARGGLDMHVRQLGARLSEAGFAVVLFVLGAGGGESVTVRTFDIAQSIYTPSLKPLHLGGDRKTIGEFLEWLAPEILHVQSLASLRWRASQILMSILAGYSRGYYVTLHDYEPICHRHHLTDRESRHCDPYRLEACAGCVSADEQAIDKVDPKERHWAYAAYLAGATRVFTPSQDAKEHFSRYFEDVAFTVREHEEFLPAAPLARAPTAEAPRHIVAIGAIGPHKGEDVIYSLARDAQQRSLPLRYSIVGYSRNTQKMASVGVVETGRYLSPAECIDTLRRIAPHFAFFPSIWPETYCYALSIALSFGLPPLVFDLGAQAARVRRAGFGVVLDKRLIIDPCGLNDKLLRLSVDDEWSRRRPVDFTRYPTFPDDYYR